MQDILDRAERYQELCMKKSQAHYVAAEDYRKKNVSLGIPVTVASSIVATSVFASLGQEKSSAWVIIGTGTLSLAAAMLSGLQTFLRYSDRAGEHRRAGIAYEGVRRSLDLFALEFRTTNDRPRSLEALTRIVSELNKVAENEPTVPQAIYRAAKYDPASKGDFTALLSANV